LGLRGGLGQIAAGDQVGERAVPKLGPVLGFLSGLEQAARPFTLFIEDALLFDTLAEQVAFMRQLGEFTSFRRMGIRLVGRRHATSLEGIGAMVEGKAAHLLWLDGRELGSLSRLLRGVAMCRAAGVGVVLGGHAQESVAAAEAAGHVALACRPDFLLSHPGQGTGIGFASLGQAFGRICASLTGLV
jgi:methylaspartate ammonia-lyase